VKGDNVSLGVNVIQLLWLGTSSTYLVRVAEGIVADDFHTQCLGVSTDCAANITVANNTEGLPM